MQGLGLSPVGNILAGVTPPNGEALQGFRLEVDWEEGHLVVTVHKSGEDPDPKILRVRVE